MDIFKSYHDKKVKGYELCVSNFEGKIRLMVKSPKGEAVLLNEFNRFSDYNRFLVEAVILRLSATDSMIYKVRGIYRKMVNFLKDNSRGVLSSFLLSGFLLMVSACSILDLKSSYSEFVHDGSVYRCEYHAGNVLKCSILKENLNEKE